MKSPAITTTLEGKNKTLYLQVKTQFGSDNKGCFYRSACPVLAGIYFFLMALLCWDETLFVCHGTQDSSVLLLSGMLELLIKIRSKSDYFSISIHH